MKKYEKPVLTAISLSGNDQLCGTCADRGNKLLKDDLNLAGEIMDIFEFGNKNDGIDGKDFQGVFGDEVECYDIQIVNYCKFTSTGTLGMVAWS